VSFLALAGGDHVRVVELLDLGRAGGLVVLGVGVLDLLRHQVVLAAGDKQQLGALRCRSRPKCRRCWPFPPTSSPTDRFLPWTLAIPAPVCTQQTVQGVQRSPQLGDGSRQLFAHGHDGRPSEGRRPPEWSGLR
jgi:hypothetical protein